METYGGREKIANELLTFFRTDSTAREWFLAGSTPNTPPTANAGPDLTVKVNTVVTLAGTGTDADGDALTYTWDFGDGSVGSGATVTHTYTTKGRFTATLTVSEGRSGIGTDTAIVRSR